jgi:hypothetical protein
MKKTLLTLACSLVLGFNSFGQNNNTDSIIKILDGEYILKSYSGGICGCTIQAQVNDSNNVRFERHPNSTDSVGYSYYSNSTLVTGYSKVAYAPFISAFKTYGWYIENLGAFMVTPKVYFQVSDTGLVLSPDDESISDGQNRHYQRKVVKGGKYTLSGEVKASNIVWDNGVVYLYDMSMGKAVDSVSFKNGSYLFASVDTGTYSVYVVPYTDTTLAVVSPNYITTYYVNKVNIQSANTFKITADTYGVDLDLIAPTTTALANDMDMFEALAYPNPFSTQLMIRADQDGVLIKVLNIQGNIIYDGILNQSMSINASEWNEGVYFVQLQTQRGVNTLTVIK